MKIYDIQNSSNWTPLEIKHEHDELVSFTTYEIKTADGLILNTSNIQNTCNDTASDKYSNYILTDTLLINDLLEVNIPNQQYPEFFTTSLLVDSYPTITTNSAYVYVVELEERRNWREYIIGNRQEDVNVGGNVWSGTTEQTYTWSQDITDNHIYFNITLHDDKQCSIAHNDNIDYTYLTYNGNPYTNDPPFYMQFETTPDNIPRDNQKFYYYINKKRGFIILYVKIDGVTYWIRPEMQESKLFTAVPALGTESNTLPIEMVLRFKPYVRNSLQSNLFNNWASYTTIGDLNNLNKNLEKSHVDVTNNYILNSTFANIEGNHLKVDPIQLKNQITIFGNVNRNNPFPNFRDVDHREYDNMFITDMEDESTGLNINYNSYETEIVAYPDEITYFNAPQNMYPYDKININDSSLIKSGAIGGDTPINSDKIFKKAASYKYNTPYGTPSDEETGTWLCSWLKSNIGVDWNREVEFKKNVIVNYKDAVYRAIVDNIGYAPDINPDEWELTEQPPPVWVDRYYNPEKFSAQEALKIEGQYSEYKTKFNHIVETLNAQNNYIFDKKSDLTFEPGALYAYYRIGPEQIKIITENMTDGLIHEGVSDVRTQNDEKITIITEDALLLGDRYIKTNTPAVITQSDFSICFNLKADDWTKPIGGQVLGNYTNQGVGVFNKQHLTPYLIFKNGTGVSLYNTQGDSVWSFPLSGCKTFVKLSGNEDITLYNDVGSESYDLKGMLVESTTPASVSGTIVDVNIDNNYHYILDSNNNVTRYDISTELWDQLNRAYPYDLVIGTPEHEVEYDVQNANWTISPNTFIQPVRDGEIQYVVNCDNYTVDTNDHLWFTKGNQVWKMALSNKQGVNSSFTGTVGSVDNEFGVSEVVLIALENLEGKKGDDITLVGDDKQSLFQLMTTWNEEHPTNRVELVRGNPSVIPQSGLENVIKLSGGENRGASTINMALSTQQAFNSIKIGHDNCIFTLRDSSKLTKMNYLRKKLVEIDITQYIEGEITQCCMDIVNEFTGSYNEYIIVICRDSNNTCNLLKLNISDLSLISNNIINLEDDINLNNQHNLTNFETHKQICKGTITSNNLTFQLRYQSYFDTDKTSIVKLTTNVENLAPGYHTFAFLFNSNNSNVTLFIDGILTATQTSDDSASGAAYKFTKTIHDPLLIGATPFFNNITFSERLGLTNYEFVNNAAVDKVRIYNKHLNFQKVKMLFRDGKKIEPITLTLPTGKRNYIDHASKFFKHKIPGKKSSKINIDILSESLSSTETQEYMSDKLLESVLRQLPINSEVERINWIS